MRFLKGAKSALGLLLAGGVCFSSANAALIENLTVSPEAASMGNAVTADPPGIFSIHYNPAGLTQFSDGTHNHLSFLLPPSIDIKLEFTAPADYEGVFGFTDDPIIGQTSELEGITAYVPTYGPYRIDDKFLPLPLGGIAHRPPGSRFVFANAAYAYAVAGFQREDPGLDADDDHPAMGGTFAGTQSIIERIVFLSPSIAMEVSDTLSFGLSAGLNYSAFYAKQNFRAANEFVGLSRFAAENICPALDDADGIPFIPPDCFGDDPLNPFGKIATIELEATDPFGLSFNMGMLWEPNPDFALGIAYQSPMTANLRGEFTFNYDNSLQSTINALSGDPFVNIIMQIFGLPTSVPEEQTGDVRIDMEFPEHVAIGTKFMLTDRLQLNVDWHWTDWEKWRTLDVVLNRPTVMTQLGQFIGISTVDRLGLNLGVENQPNFGVGMRYYLSSRTEVRFGVENRKSSIPDDKKSALLPFGDTMLYGTGIAYKFSGNMTMDFSLVHFNSKQFIPAGSSSNANSTDIDNAFSPYAGLDVETEAKGTLAAFTIKAMF